MFNLLTDKLPTSVIVDNVEYPVNWDAGTMIKISILIENSTALNDEDSINLINEELGLFFNAKIPSNTHDAMSALIDFYTYSKSKSETKQNPNKVQSSKRSYSFQHDSDLIYAAFLQQYPGRDIKTLHWFEFKSMMEGLTDDCLFVKVIQYRTMKIPSSMSKSEKSFYRRMKRLYALPDDRPKEMKDGEFAAALAGL